VSILGNSLSTAVSDDQALVITVNQGIGTYSSLLIERVESLFIFHLDLKAWRKMESYQLLHNFIHSPLANCQTSEDFRTIRRRPHVVKFQPTLLMKRFVLA